MLIYTSNITERLRYISAFAGDIFQLTDNLQLYQQSNDGRINYSSQRIIAEELWIQPHTLLFEKDIRQQTISCFTTAGMKAFFETNGDFPFDIFAASFYLLTRYEEYLPHEKDMYGRYAHTNSLAFREGFLDQPLVDRWWKLFRDMLNAKFPNKNIHERSRRKFMLLPTYDIDIAWSYKDKGWWRNLGGFLHSLVKGDWKGIRERWAVVNAKKKDPFDTYGWLNRLHERYGLRPYYFFLLASRTGRYDKNISPAKKSMHALISDHLLRYPVGIHPSWRSGDDHAQLQQEIARLQSITGNKVLASRQHYIRFNLPGDLRRLTDAGIHFDFSMGYGSINGFRASVATPYTWYDLEKEMTTSLTLFPFCYMDANSFYEQQYSAQQALTEMQHYSQVTRDVEGTFILIWHNHFLGSDPLYAGWREVYEKFIAEVAVPEK